MLLLLRNRLKVRIMMPLMLQAHIKLALESPNNKIYPQIIGVLYKKMRLQLHVDNTVIETKLVAKQNGASYGRSLSTEYPRDIG